MAQKAAANVQTSNFRSSLSVTHLEEGKGVNNRSRYAKFCRGAETPLQTFSCLLRVPNLPSTVLFIF